MVTGAGGPAGINFIKSIKLVDPRMYVIGIDINRYMIHLSPADERFIVPRCDDPTYIPTLIKIAKENDISFIHPQPDVEVAVIGVHKQQLMEEGIHTFLPSSETITICQSKYLSNQFWKKADIPTAGSIMLSKPSDVDRAFREYGSPIWIRASSGAGGKGSTPCNNSKTAYSWMEYWKSRNRNMMFLAQEYLEGRNIGWHSLWHNGELITSMARERLEYIYPYLSPSGITGTPTVQRTIHDDAVNEVAYGAVKAIDDKYNGIACVDLKEDKDHLPRVTEINPGRMFTTSYFFSSLSYNYLQNNIGNFPINYLDVAFGKIPELPPFNSLPKDIYWIRHLDIGEVMIGEDEIANL